MIPNICSKKRPSINLSLFINNLSESFLSSDNHVPSKSPRTFDGGVVGLGIVAAMNEMKEAHHGFSSAKTSRVAKLAISPRSEPIPIVFVPKFKEPPSLEKDEMELSESYTCVISDLGNGDSFRKIEYFDGGAADGRNGKFEGVSKSGVFFTSPPKNTEVAAATLFQSADFLSCCYLCRKKLHGLDIFMYRGDKAFCSAECRYKQILSDENRAKCGPGARKSFAYSVSPCSAPMIFSAGVAAA